MSKPDMVKCCGCKRIMDLESWTYSLTPARSIHSQGHCPHCRSATFWNVKPLFIALKAEFFDAFEKRVKRVEYRKRSKQFNGQTCFVGRDVILSRGYGKARRLTGKIVSFHYDTVPEKLPGWVTCYGKGAGDAACIGIELD